MSLVALTRVEGVPATPAAGTPGAVASAALPATGVALLLALTGLALGLADGRSPGDFVHLLFVVACLVTGGLVARRRPDNRVGLTLFGCGACFALLECLGQAALRFPEGSGAAAVLGWPQTWLWVPGNVLLALTPVFFPDGQAAPGWRRPLQVLAVLGAVTAVLAALRPGQDGQLGRLGRPNPLGVPGLGTPADVAAAVFTLVAASVIVIAGARLLLHVRRLPAGSRLRQQVAWPAYALGLSAAAVLARLVAGLTDDDPHGVWPADAPAWDALGSLTAALVPVALGVAVIRHRLFDIDRLISRTLLLVVLTGAVVGLYLAVVALAGGLLGGAVELPASVVAAGIAALVLAPIRRGVQRRVDRLLYGERGDPYAVLARLGRQLEESDSSGSLGSAAHTVREALQLPGIGVDVDGGERIIAGRLPASPVEIPLLAGGERVGRLLVGPRPGEAALGRRDLRLLRDLAPSMAAAVLAARETDRAGRLAEDLQASRERLVLAREEERRRLRRDVHDGLGPLLAGLAMRAETAREVDDPVVARALLEEVADDARTALVDVRRLVDGLRPPALDTLGLVGALRAHLSGRPHPAVPVAVEVPVPLPSLPAAVEVAAYRIAVEAVSNVDRHAGAGAAAVRLQPDGDRLRLEVSDDGRGGATTTSGGVGLASMRERAAELGGSCTVTPRAGGGTVVHADLPLDRHRDGGDGGSHPRPAG